MTEVIQQLQEIKNFTRSVLLPNKEGLLLDAFEQEFRGIVGIPFPHQHLGFRTSLALLLSMPDEVFVEHLSSGHILLRGIPDQSTEHVARMVSNQRPNLKGYNKKTARIIGQQDSGFNKRTEEIQPSKSSETLPLPEHIRHNVKQVIMRFPNGLSYEMFKRAYLETTCINLDVRQLGFNNLETFFQRLTNENIVQLNYEANTILVKPSYEIITGQCSNSISRPERRKDVMGQQDKISEQRLPCDLKVGDFLEVIVAEVFNPYRFWIQLKGEQTSKMLAIIMDQMEDLYYREESDQFKIPDSGVEVGLVCASLYSDGNWYRAYIKSMLDLSTVEVFYVDYGTAAKVKKDSLRYLPRKFGKLPGQAIEARLAGIKPEGGLRRFTKETSSRFLELVRMPPDVVGLVAVVRGLATKLTLWLVDTTTNHLPEGVAVNQVLVDEGLAEPEVLVDDDPVLNQKRSSMNHLAPLRRPVMSPKSNSMDFSSVKTSIPNLPQSNKSQITAMEVIRSKMDPSTPCTKGIVEQLNNLLQINKMTKEMNPQKEDNVDPGDGQVIMENEIRPLSIAGYKVHMVLLDKAAWITSYQISQLIPNWKGRDILARMLKLKRMSVESLVVSSASHPNLYMELLEGGMGRSEGEEVRMYPLNSIPHILNFFLKLPTTELRKAFEEEITRFDSTFK